MAKQLQKQQTPVAALARFLEGRRDEIAKILPKGVSPDRVVKTAVMAAMESPQIQQCTPLSVYRSVMQASLMGIVVGSGFSEGYLIPYRGECTFRASYIGWTKIARRSEGVDIIRASIVHEHDEFEISEQPPSAIHKPRWADGERGRKIGALAVAYTRAGSGHDLYDFCFVPADELAQARKLGSENGPWKSWPNEMAKKVAIRRLCKALPRTPELEKLQAIEARADNGNASGPDPDIDDLEQIVEAKFEEATAEEAAPERGSRTSQLKESVRKMRTGGKASPSDDSRDDSRDEEPPPPSDDVADYGPPAGDVEF